ncbi:MAG: hypothetical protein HQL54_06495 [Magnetococcales bacterium]|nr:hypothetical protein [Magnetococcales bacterium]
MKTLRSIVNSLPGETITTQYAPVCRVWINEPDQGHKHSDGRYKISQIFEANHSGVREIQALCNRVVERIQPSLVEEMTDKGYHLNMGAIIWPWRYFDMEEKAAHLRGRVLVTSRSRFKPTIIDSYGVKRNTAVPIRKNDRVAITAEAKGIVVPHWNGQFHPGVTLRLNLVHLTSKAIYRVARPSRVIPFRQRHSDVKNQDRGDEINRVFPSPVY